MEVIINIISITTGIISIILALYAIWFAKKESENSTRNYNNTKELLKEIENRAEIIDRAIQFQQTQLVDIINKSLDKIGQTPIEFQPISPEAIEALFDLKTEMVEIPNGSGGTTVIIDSIRNIAKRVEDELKKI